MSEQALNETAAPPIETSDADGAAQIVKTFSSRLNTLLDNAGFPSVNAGRYSALGARYAVARQQAHRWCNAQALPGPHILTRIAIDFGTTLDWLFGVESMTSAGIEVPLYRLRSPDVEAVQSNFLMLGRMRFLPSSPTAGRCYAILQNWSESLEPPFLRGEELLIDLSSQSLDEGGYYVIRTATSTSVRKAVIEPGGTSVRFIRSTPLNTFGSSYQVEDIFHNETQRFDATWTHPGVLVIGRVEATMRSLLGTIPSFLST